MRTNVTEGLAKIRPKILQKYLGPAVTVRDYQNFSGNSCLVVTVDPTFLGTNVRFLVRRTVFQFWIWT